MKTTEKTQIRVICEPEAGNFETKVNDFMSEHCKEKPVLKVMDGQSFCALITYTVTEDIPETLEDEFFLKGMHFYCADCPHMEEQPDKRKVWHNCKFAEFGQTRADSSACEYHLREILRGGTNV